MQKIGLEAETQLSHSSTYNVLCDAKESFALMVYNPQIEMNLPGNWMTSYHISTVRQYQHRKTTATNTNGFFARSMHQHQLSSPNSQYDASTSIEFKWNGKTYTLPHSKDCLYTLPYSSTISFSVCCIVLWLLYTQDKLLLQLYTNKAKIHCRRKA